MSSVDEVMPTPMPTPSAQFSTSDNFQGWWYLGDTLEQLTCDEPQTFATSDGYADCFGPTGITPMATGCEGPTTLLKEDNGDNRICPESYECGSYKILLTERAPDEDGWVRHACLLNSGWRAHTVFRTLPPSYLTSASASVRTIAVTKPYPTTHQASSTASPTAASSPATDGGISGGAIGGIVVGCVAAVAIVALLFFRRKIMACLGHNKPHIENGPTWLPVYMPMQSVAPSDSTWRRSEMSAEQGAIHEIGSSQATLAPRPPVVHEAP